jgi:hypothetical protein
LDGGGQVRQTGAATRSKNVATQRAAMDEPSLRMGSHAPMFAKAADEDVP